MSEQLLDCHYDAIVLACALQAKCDILLAWDEPLSVVKHESIRIEEPRMIGRLLITPSEKATPEEIEEYERARQQTTNLVATRLPKGGLSPT